MDSERNAQPAGAPARASARTAEEIEALRQLGNTAPVAKLTGMQIVRVSPGEAEVVLAFQPSLMQAHGRVHGGLFGLVADTAGYFAAASLQAADGVTLEYKVNLLEGLKDEGMRAVGRVVKSGRSISLCDIEIFSERGVLIGKALATYRFFSR